MAIKGDITNSTLTLRVPASVHSQTSDPRLFVAIIDRCAEHADSLVFVLERGAHELALALFLRLCVGGQLIYSDDPNVLVMQCDL